jgi:hypothetical protein
VFKLSPNSFLAKLVQTLLAVSYVALVRQLLAIQASFFGEVGSGLWHTSVVLVIVSVGLLLLFLVNFALLRHSFLRLGLFTSLAIFIYYYIYNPQGHYILLLAGLLRSPPHLINMLLLVAAPVLVGRFIQSRVGTGAVHA